MGKCVMCGKSGLFLRINEAGLCKDCATAETPERKREKWIQEFVDTTPMEQIYPVGGASTDKISFGSDKVADSLGISTYDAYKLLNVELSRRGLPHTAPPDLQKKVELRIEEDLKRWQEQIRDYVDTIPPDEREDPLMSLDHEKEIVKRFSIPRRISSKLWLDELYTRSDAYKHKQELERKIQEENAHYQCIEFKVVGVTFKNGRRSRQTILRQIYFKDQPYDKPPRIRLEQYEYEGKPAFSVWANDEQVGNIGKDDIPNLLSLWERYDSVTEFTVYGGGEGRSYGMKIMVRFTK